MGRIRKWSRKSAVILVFLITAMLFQGCNAEKASTDTKKQTVQKEKSSDKKVNSEGEIPDELLPGAAEDQQDISTEETADQEKATVFDASEEGIASGKNPGQSSGSSTTEENGETQESGGSGQKTGETEPARIQVNVSVESSAVGNLVSYGGSVTLDRGASVYDALTALAGNAVSGSSSYVTGIGGLSEKDYGAKSGWLYSVNGKYPNKGAGSYVVHDGDVVVWSYTK